jgi:hypothetical protein
VFQPDGRAFGQRRFAQLFAHGFSPFAVETGEVEQWYYSLAVHAQVTFAGFAMAEKTTLAFRGTPVTAAHSRDDKIRQLAKVIVTFEMGMGTIGAYSHAAIAIDAFDGGYGVVFADFTVRVQGSNSLASVEGAAGLGRLDEALYGESCRRAGGCQSCATGHSAPSRCSCSGLVCWPCR